MRTPIFTALFAALVVGMPQAALAAGDAAPADANATPTPAATATPTPAADATPAPAATAPATSTSTATATSTAEATATATPTPADAAGTTAPASSPVDTPVPGPAPATADAPPATPPATPVPAGPAARALAAIPPAGPARIEWYVPQDLDLADGNLDWNSSILGGFDPWTKQKVTILFQSQALDLTLPGGDGMVDYDQPDGSTAKNTYPDARFSGSYPGVRLEWGNWSLAFAKATGSLDWGPDAGAPRVERGTSYQGMIARGFGAWAIVDTGGDLRIGISWPELFLRVVYGQYDSDPALPKVQQAIVGMGVSLLGIRATLGDLLFAEIRAGEWAYHVAGAYIDFRDDTDKDILVQRVSGFQLRPTFRIGIAL